MTGQKLGNELFFFKDVEMIFRDNKKEKKRTGLNSSREREGGGGLAWFSAQKCIDGVLKKNS